MNYNPNTSHYSPEDLLLAHIFGAYVLQELHPISERQYYIDSREYLVISHYVGKKDIDKVLNDIAIRKAYADIKWPPLS